MNEQGKEAMLDLFANPMPQESNGNLQAAGALTRREKQQRLLESQRA
jgi:hypothetical protein